MMNDLYYFNFCYYYYSEGCSGAVKRILGKIEGACVEELRMKFRSVVVVVRGDVNELQYHETHPQS